MRRVALLAFLGSMIVGVGCGPVLIEDLEDDGTGNNNSPASFANDVFPKMQNSCGLSGCHSGPTPQGDFGADGACADVHTEASSLVNTSDVANSELLIYATGGNSHTGGAPIASGGADYQTWWSWIEGGAGNDC